MDRNWKKNRCNSHGWRKITGVLCNRRVENCVKGRRHTTMVRPAMIYGMETVPLTKIQERKMEGMEMRMLRFALGITRKDKIRNEVVRKRMKVGRL